MAQIITRTVIIFSFLCIAQLSFTGCRSVPSDKGASFSEQDLFVSGTLGYHTFRIPALLNTRDQVVLAFCEARKNNRSDTGNIDLAMRRSEDGGKTWSETTIIWDDGENVCGNPCPVFDRETGEIHLLLTWNLGSDHERDIIEQKAQDTRRVFVMKSSDLGKTWTTPADITTTTKSSDWGWYATGPGNGIQIENGPHAGRLVIPCDHSYTLADSAEKKYEYGSHIIFSDDHGASWQMGGVIRPKVNECQVVELGQGQLLMNMRSYFGRNLRTHSLSSDGGITWGPPEDVVDLTEPVCQASLIRIPDGSPILVFSNPDSTARAKMTVKYSSDQGKSWQDYKVLFKGPSAYSSLTLLGDNLVGCLYEKGENSPYEKISLARFVAPQ